MTLEAFVNNKRLELPPDTKVSIERNSPLLNSDTGDFSYPFEVNTEKNADVLAYPHRLTRKTALPEQSFVLKDQGLHILSGAVDYDDDACSLKSIGLLFKSGYSRLYSRINGKTLRQINLDSFQIWDEDSSQTEVESILSGWNGFNTTAGPFQAVLAPTAVDNSSETIIANPVDTTTGDLDHNIASGAITWNGFNNVPATILDQYYLFQIRIWYILEKIFTYAGYSITTNELQESSYSDSVLFTNPIHVYGFWITYQITETRIFPHSSISFADLMPSVDVGDFLEAMKNLFNLQFEFNEHAGTVEILLVRNIITKSPVSNHRLLAIDEPKSSPKPTYNGYRLSYSGQDNSEDSEDNFTVTRSILTETMPPAELEGEVVHFTQYNYYYEAADDNNDLEWKRIGRLKPIVSGVEPYLETEINVKIPRQVVGGGAEVPMLNATISKQEQPSGVVAVLNDLYVSMYRGNDKLDGIVFPLLVAEEFTLYDESLSYAPVGFYDHLQLKDFTGLDNEGIMSLHGGFLTWMVDARHVIMQFKCELIDVLRLQFDERYTDPSFIALFEKISFDLPFDGFVEIEGYAK